MDITARFHVHDVQKLSGAVMVYMHPVYGEGNEQWAAATPSGQMHMIITNPNLQEQFEPGQDYEITMKLL